MNTSDYSTEVIAGVHLIGTQQQRTGGYSLENPNLPLNDPNVWEAVFGDSYGTDSGVSVTAEKAMMYAPFYHGVSLIADDVACLPRYVFKRRPDITPDAREYATGHKLNYTLNTATSENTESIKFWCRFMRDGLIYNNAYARIGFDGTGSPAELYNLLPDRTHPEIIDGQLWYVTEINSDRSPKLVALFPWEVITIENPNCLGVAKPLFQLARNAIALGLAQEKFASKFFANGGRVGGILELPAGMPKPARDTIEEGFRKTYEGADNPFKTVILRDNAKFHAAQQSPHDSQMIEATEAQTRAIAHFLKLQPSRLGLSDSVSYNSKSEDNQDYLNRTLQIWLKRIEASCNFRLIPERQANTYFIEHDTTDLLKMNPLQAADMDSKLIAARVINPNEARAKRNLLPYEGGNEFVNPNTMKSGNDTQPKPEDKPAEQPPKPAPKRDAPYMRVLFGITASAREKAKNPNALSVWLKGGLVKHRDDWKYLKGDKPFGFDELEMKLRAASEHYPEDQLPKAVDSLCQQFEEAA